MSEDPEEKIAFVSSTGSSSLPLRVCSATCRLSNNPLSLREIVKLAVCVLILQTICAGGLAISRSETSILIWLCIFQVFTKCILYTFMYINLLSGGWGSSNSRFWCDIKIMYVRGFNTIRSITDMASFTLYLWITMLILEVDSELTAVLLPLLAVIAEWQAGLSENQLQDDVNVADKFITDENLLSLEGLHWCQSQKKDPRTVTVPFVAHCLIKTYVFTGLLISGRRGETSLIFGIPIVGLIVFYTYIVTLTLDFMYIKRFQTFCQIELYKTILDLIFPGIIVAFSLV